MVAYTPDLCIPFFEASDNPCTMLGDTCNPVSVWCSAMQIVEDHLTDLDTIVARTVTAIPLAMVSFVPTDPVAGNVNGTVPFDIVNLDTDNMVDLSVFPGITPRRNGIYIINAQVAYAPIIANDFPDVRIFIGNEQAPEQGGALDAGPVQGTTRGFNTLQYVHLSTHWMFNDTSPQPRTVSVVNTYLTGAVFEAHLTVAWHSDLDG